MNTLLAALLAKAGLENMASRPWHDMSIHNNFGSVPRCDELFAEFAQKGFKLILLDGEGRTLLAQCGDADDAALSREASIVMALGNDVRLSRVVPRAWHARSGAVQLLVRQFVSGQTFERLAPRTARRWLAACAGLLDARNSLEQYAVEAAPWLLREGPTASVRNEIAPLLDRLGRAGFSTVRIRAIDDAVRSVESVPRAIQHGDFWPGNVIRQEDRWWIIDFAEFAQIQVPLYDIFHFVMHSRNGAFDMGAEPLKSAWSRARRALVRGAATRYGLTAEQSGAAFVYYLAHIAAYRLRPGVDPRYQNEWLIHLGQVADALRRGVSVSRLSQT